MVIQVGQTLNVDLHDRVMEAYYGKLGEKFMKETQKRIHWIAERVQGSSILDVGCSQGTLSILLGREGRQVVGLDSSAKSILEAKGYLAQEEQKTQSRVAFIQSDFLSHDFNGELFDTIVIAEVLEHLVDPQSW